MSEPKNVNKWGEVVKVSREEEPPYEDLEGLKLLNVMKVHYNLIDDPKIIVLYVQEIDNYQSCYFTKTIEPSRTPMGKVLYV